jgi:PAT family beta-lactamase induction signal transducer AmpG
MGPMPRLVWKHSGLSLEEIGWFLTPLNLACVVIGSIAGGMAIPKLGVLRGLFWFGLAQASSNAVYAVVAAMGGTSERILFATGYENFTAGLGTAALLSLLMRMCGKEQAATEYALLSALFALVRFPAKMVSGVGVESLGYSGFFWLTTALAVPGLLSLFSVKLAQRIGEPPLARH